MTRKAACRVINVVGARPNFMKIAPLAHEMALHADIEHLITHTGQHYDQNLSDVFFDELGIPRPDINLGVGSGSREDQIAEIMGAFDAVVAEHRPHAGVLATMQDARLARALSYIHDHHDKDLDLNRLAREAGMSRTAFATRFHDVMGKPPATYLTEWRMLQARRLLVRTETPISEITERVGYGSDAAFVRAFKRRFGETPARLRRAAAG